MTNSVLDFSRKQQSQDTWYESVGKYYIQTGFVSGEQTRAIDRLHKYFSTALRTVSPKTDGMIDRKSKTQKRRKAYG